MAKSIAKSTKKAAPAASTSKRGYVKQSDVPSASLDDALRVPQAIFEHYAGRPTSPLHVAKALNVEPGGSQLRVLSGAAIAFGLIDGGAQAATISVTDLARQILRPKEEGADLAAKRAAVLTPRIFGEFLRNYDGNAFPREDIAVNVLEEMGVPREKTREVLDRIQASAQTVGFMEEIKGKKYVTLQGAAPALRAADGEEAAGGANGTPASAMAVNGSPSTTPDRASATGRPIDSNSATPATGAARSTLAIAIIDDERRRKVFITHGKNRDLVEPIRKLLEFGEMIPVVSVERSSVSKPVPEKVMDDMRMCGAAIIHVDGDKTIVDKDGNEHVLLNPNVLIEIGAAMAFYGRRFILLVREGVKLPSNLQGLYEVRYAGEVVDANATIRLLEAIKDIKNYALPADQPTNET